MLLFLNKIFKQLGKSKDNKITRFDHITSKKYYLKRFQLVTSNPPKTQPTYRPYIDGLRAIAILSVVGFHYFPWVIKGGFVGVDVFFVISGFLISAIIFREVKEGTFSYINFYARRIKRIFPALAITLLVTLIFGYLFAFPDELISIGKQIAGSTVFVSNLIFYRESGYFDTSAELKPLLHLWSLGIEEQYYILWPLLVALLFKRLRSFLPIILFFLITSFLLNAGLVFKHPTATFYLPMTRFWELLIGSMLAYISLEYGCLIEVIKQLLKSHRITTLKLHDLFAWVGISLIITSIFCIRVSKHFPGYWALLPTIGTFFIIGAGTTAWFNQKVLTNPILVFFGLISYPLYLWHWSLLAFFRILKEEPSLQIRTLIIFSSIILAWLTCKFIENPIRFGKQTPIKIILLILMLALLGGAGAYMYESGGLPNRSFVRNWQMLTKDLVHDTSTHLYHPCPAQLKNSKPSLNFCLQSKSSTASAVIFGDSHADHLFRGIAKVDSGHSWLLTGNSSCAPVSGINIEGGDVSECQKRIKNIISYLKTDQNIQLVVLSFFGNTFKDTSFAADHVKSHNGPSPMIKITGEKNSTLKNKADLFQYGLENVVSKLESAGKKIVIITDVPEVPFFPRDCIPRRLFNSSAVTKCSISKQIVLQRQDQLRVILKNIKNNHPNIRIFDPLNFMCNEKDCRVKIDDVLLYRDSHHLSTRGSELFAKNFIPWIYKG